MFVKILSVIKSLFSSNKFGILFSILFSSATKQVAKEIVDPENQKKAFEFVKELHNRTDMTNQEKMDEFNLKMLSWAKQIGKTMQDSVINCLRELAVTALYTKLASEKPEEN